LKLHRVYYLIDEAEAKFIEGALEETIANINEALKIKSDCDDAYLDLGLIYMRLRNLREGPREPSRRLLK
jgi:tetratricopeptide (TPR) repeat protein